MFTAAKLLARRAVTTSSMEPSADNQFWPEFMGKLLAQVKFDKLAYKPTW